MLASSFAFFVLALDTFVASLSNSCFHSWPIRTKLKRVTKRSLPPGTWEQKIDIACTSITLQHLFRSFKTSASSKVLEISWQ
jgi:hypothetical protein